MTNIFPAKLLLFGEYLVLEAGEALAMPLTIFGGYWKHKVPTDIALWKYLAFIESEPELVDQIHIMQFKEALENGLRFESSIPVGYGLGSSACLVSAILKTFGRHEIDSNKKLQSVLALMESPFHGKSSGFDPLVIFKNKPVFSQQGNIKFIKINEGCWQAQKPFLLNSEQGRETKKLVQHFKKQLESDTYKTKIIEEAIPLSNSLIQSLINGQTAYFQDKIQGFSELQLTLFSDMIPDHIKTIWKKGLSNGQFTIKLCGAGGGGFFLGFGTPPKELKTTPLV